MDIISIIKYLDDPHRDHKKECSLECILYITLAGVIVGSEGWDEVEECALCKRAFFASRIKGFGGVPSENTFNRVFQLLDPVQFESYFRPWIQEICDKYAGVVSIEGKESGGIRQENSDGSFPNLHMVNAWAIANGITFGEERAGRESNEITAIPALIEILDLKDCTITIDALECQKEITQAILKKEANYVICLKESQSTSYSKVKNWFENLDHNQDPSIDYDVCSEEKQPRDYIEKRSCDVYSSPELSLMCAEWEGFKSVARVCAYRKEIATGEQREDIRYFITSLSPDAPKISECIGKHWNIENNLHWQLNVAFREDDTRKDENAAQNLSLIT
ncbi:MAG TPA: ISAs1 family transposase, partial [Bacteroides reticulotermitis]|nr:ISAs1 family transposase [Bacteroides reticulotermitis]